MGKEACGVEARGRGALDSFKRMVRLDCFTYSGEEAAQFYPPGRAGYSETVVAEALRLQSDAVQRAMSSLTEAHASCMRNGMDKVDHMFDRIARWV